MQQELLYFNDPAQVAGDPGNYLAATCSVDDNMALLCKSTGLDTLVQGGEGLEIQKAGPVQAGYTLVMLSASV